MRKRSITAAAFLAVALPFGAGHAETRQVVYVANGLNAITGVNTTEMSPGATFGAGKVPKTIKVADLDGGDIAVDVCQNKVDDGFNCGAGDAIFSYCTPANSGAVTIPTGAGFVASQPTTVFVNITSETAISASCDGIGTAGTIDMTF